MLAFNLALVLFACGGESSSPAPSPEAAPEPAPAEPAPEPAPAEAAALEPLEVTLEDNQKTCLGDADCTVVSLDCCGCASEGVPVTHVAVNKSSVEAVTKKHKRAEADCAAVTCQEGCTQLAAKCESFKCAMAE